MSAVRTVNRGEIDHPTFNAYLQRHFTPCDPIGIRQASLRAGAFVRCTQSRPGPQQVAILGDSHAEQVFLGLSEVFPEYNFVYYTRTTSPANPGKFRDILNYVESNKTIKTVIFASYWALYTTNTQPPIQFAPDLASAVARMRAAGKTVILLDDPPNFSFDPPKCKFKRPLGDNKCADPQALYAAQTDGFYPQLRKVADAEPGVRIVETHRYFCDDSLCRMALDGQVLYRDRNHINIEGSRYLARRLRADYPRLLD
jgi:hypothetical protein